MRDSIALAVIATVVVASNAVAQERPPLTDRFESREKSASVKAETVRNDTSTRSSSTTTLDRGSRTSVSVTSSSDRDTTSRSGEQREKSVSVGVSKRLN